MADDLFANVPSEGTALDIDKAFDRLNRGEESSESQPEKNTASSSRQDEKNTDSEEKTPFHKHPRWQKTQRELQELRDELKTFKEAKTEPKQVDVPDWWKKSFGDTQESSKKYQEYETATQAERDRIKAEVKADLQNEVKADQTQVTQAEQYVDEQLAEMSEEGMKFERNSLLKFMVEFQNEFGAGSLLDKEGNYDFRKSLKLMQKMETEVVDGAQETRKQLASQAGRSKSFSGNSTKIPVISHRDLRRGWREAGI